MILREVINIQDGSSQKSVVHTTARCSAPPACLVFWRGCEAGVRSRDIHGLFLGAPGLSLYTMRKIEKNSEKITYPDCWNFWEISAVSILLILTSCRSAEISLKSQSVFLHPLLWQLLWHYRSLSPLYLTHVIKVSKFQQHNDKHRFFMRNV